MLFDAHITGTEKPYFIEPKNMERRLRIFIEQVLPDMFDVIDSVEEAWFQIQVLHRQCDRISLQEVFDWKEIPGNDTEKLQKVLTKFFNIQWNGIVIVEKIGYGDSIVLHCKKNKFSIKLNRTKEFLMINGIQVNFIVKDRKDNKTQKVYITKLTEEQDERLDNAVADWIEKWEIKIQEKGLPKILPKKTPIPDTSNLLGGFKYPETLKKIPDV